AAASSPSLRRRAAMCWSIVRVVTSTSSAAPQILAIRSARDTASPRRSASSSRIFALRERHAPAVSPGFARTKIDDYVAGIEAPRGVVTGGAPQQSAYSSDELHKTEGLGNIVIGAELQTAHPVHLLPSRCQYQHPGVARSRSQFFEHVKAGDPGQHHIQYVEGVDPAERLLQSGAPVGGVSYLVTFQPERVAEPR